VRKLKIALTQFSMEKSRADNVKKAFTYIEQASKGKADLILLPELFLGHYFCSEENEKFFHQAIEKNDSIIVKDFAECARKNNISIIFSFFEKEGPHYYNSVLHIQKNGELSKVYRKSHIPDGPGYEEKFFFKPGNTGFKVWSIEGVSFGVGICWDQWFPETARILALQGAEFLLYPTAIGTEPQDNGLDTRHSWRTVMLGHAVANAVPVLAANRVGQESKINFYGTSFVADHSGKVIQELNQEEGLLFQDFDFDVIKEYRAAFGFFRDRRPDLYAELVKN